MPLCERMCKHGYCNSKIVGSPPLSGTYHWAFQVYHQCLVADLQTFDSCLHPNGVYWIVYNVERFAESGTSRWREVPRVGDLTVERGSPS